MTTPTFVTRRDARRFFLGFAFLLVSLSVFIVAMVEAFPHGTHGEFRSGWLFLSNATVLLLLVGSMIASGPIRRAIGSAKGFGPTFRLYSVSGLHRAYQVARTGPEGKPPRRSLAQPLFRDRSEALLFLVGALLMPLGLILTLTLSIAFAGTGPKNPTPSWVGFIAWVSVAGLLLALRPIRRFWRVDPERKETADEANHPRLEAFGLFFSSDGLGEAIRAARGH